MQSIYVGQERKLVLFGQNDTDEPNSLSYGEMIVLDPTKLPGKSEASESRGFGLPVAEAELYVIRFPLSEMNIVWKTHANADRKTLSFISFKNLIIFMYQLKQ